jgi:hypothetical protein
MLNPLYISTPIHDAFHFSLEGEEGFADTVRNSAITPVLVRPAQGVYLYQADYLHVMDKIIAKYPDGCFDMIFADPPCFLSNDGISCHAGKMVSVNKRA